MSNLAYDRFFSICCIFYILFLSFGFFPFPTDLENYGVVQVSSPFKVFGSAVQLLLISIAFFDLIRFLSLGQSALRIFPREIILFLTLLYGWALVSVLWSPDYSAALKALVIQFVHIVALLIFTRHINNFSRMIEVIFVVIFVALIVSMFGIYFMPTRSIHTLSDGVLLADDLNGLWRGVYIHKNYAAGVFAILAIISFFLFVFESRRKYVYFVALVGSIVFLAYSQSLTALFGVSFSIAMGIILTVFPRSIKKIMIFFIVLVPFLFPIFAVFYLFPEYGISFDSRTYIWRANFYLVGDKLLTGVGFKSMYTGFTDIRIYDNFGFISRIGTHAHSGFVEILGQLGIVGVLICFLLFVIGSFALVDCLHNKNYSNKKYSYIIITIFVFCFIRSTFEPDFINNRFQWYFIVLIFSVVFKMKGSGRREALIR